MKTTRREKSRDLILPPKNKKRQEKRKEKSKMDFSEFTNPANRLSWDAGGVAALGGAASIPSPRG